MQSISVLRILSKVEGKRTLISVWAAKDQPPTKKGTSNQSEKPEREAEPHPSEQLEREDDRETVQQTQTETATRKGKKAKSPEWSPCLKICGQPNSHFYINKHA